MIGLNCKVLEDFGELGIEETCNLFIKDIDLKNIKNDDSIISNMLSFLKNKFSVKSNETLEYLGKDLRGGRTERFVFEILGNKSTVNNIRRHIVLYVECEVCVEVCRDSNKSYIRLNTDDLDNYINSLNYLILD